MIGIYEIRNKLDGKIYIGSTTKSLEKRWKDHQKFLRLKQHRNRFLQHAWNKYGSEVFEFVVLEEIQSPQDILNREQYWIDQYFDNGINCYNLVPTAGSVLGLKWKKSSKNAKSDQTKILWENQEIREKITNGLKNRKYKKAPLGNQEKERLANQGREFWKSENGKAVAYKFPCKSHPGLVSPEGKIFETIINLNKFCKEHLLTYQAAWNVCHGKAKSHKGWKSI